MKITREMVVELNSELTAMGCPFRYKFEGKKCTANNPNIELTLPSINYVSSFTIYTTKEFSEWLDTWFGLRGIELSRNNDGSILWSKSGWDDNKNNNMVDEANDGEIKRLFKGSHFDYGYYAYLDRNGKFVIGEERGRDGGVLYCGEYKRENTPWLSDIKEENVKLYNSIVSYFGF